MTEVIINVIKKRRYKKQIMSLDPRIMEDMNLEIGDFLQLTNPKVNETIILMVTHLNKGDTGRCILRVQSSMREKLKASINDKIKIKKIDVKSAKKIVLAGVEEAIKLRNEQALVKILENRVVNINDKLQFYVMGGKIDFIIIDSEPRDEPVRITMNTEIMISETSYKNMLKN
ncbi:MAG: hypothetical protein ACFFAK_16240 [Promethearchaeota archaeon]